MRVLLDECIPTGLKRHLPGHDCRTVPEEGLAGKKNGELLVLAEKSGFEVFITLDRGVEYQQSLKPSTIAVVLLRARSSRLAELITRTPSILKALASSRPGQLTKVGL